MSKVAKLVYVSLATRVVVEEDATESEILDKAKPNFYPKIQFELGEHLEDIVDDIECPYDPKTDL